MLPDSEWSLTDQLLAAVVDQLALANWQRGGGKGQRPSPVPRPGVSSSSKTVTKGEPMSIEEAREWARRQKEGV